jgi:hypothetical protein
MVFPLGQNEWKVFINHGRLDIRPMQPNLHPAKHPLAGTKQAGDDRQDKNRRDKQRHHHTIGSMGLSTMVDYRQDAPRQRLALVISCQWLYIVFGQPSIRNHPYETVDRCSHI